ncbi:MAG: hypothetical protein WAV20_11040 [Blastocatellia bacterium]
MECSTFSEVLDAADALSPQEQETLIDILRHRIAESNRQRLIEEVQEARRDFAQGQCQEATVDEIMRESLS